MRHIIGEQNETNDFSDKLKTAYLEALSPDAQLTPSDLLTLLYVGEIIAAYLPQSPTTLSDIQRVLGPRILQIEVQMPFRRGDIYSTAYEKLLHAIEHPETTMPTPKPKAQVVFEQPRAPVEKPRRTKVRSIGRQKTQRPRQTRQTKAELRAQEKKARTDQEALLIAQVKELRALTGKDRLTKAQIAARLGISERRVTGIITDLLAAGEIKKSDYRPGKTGIKPETRQLWNRIKKLRNPSRNLSNEQIAARLGITPIHLRNVLTKMIAAGELEPRSSDAPVVERPQSDHTKTLAYQIQDMVELLRTTASSLTNAEIAARLEPHFGQVSERTVARAITLLIQAGRIPSSQGRRPPKQL